MESFKKLINEVKKYEILYDRSMDEYSDEDKKNLAWESVGQSTNMTGERARKKWENIHNAYIGSKSTGSVNKFASLLGFLEIGDGNRTFSALNVSHSASFLEGPKETSFVEQSPTPRSKRASFVERPSTPNSKRTSVVERPSTPKSKSFIEQTSTPKSSKRKRVHVEESHEEEAELSHINDCDSPPVNISTTSVAVVTGGQDDIDVFCNLVATRLRMLPDDQIKISKRHILEILHKSEINSL